MRNFSTKRTALTQRAATLFSLALMAMPIANRVDAQGIAGPYLASRQASLSSDYAEGAKYFQQAITKDPENIVLLESALVTMIGKGDMQQVARIVDLYRAAGGQSRLFDIVEYALQIEKGQFNDIPEPSSVIDGIDPLFDGLVHAWAQLGKGNMAAATSAFETIAENEDFSSFAYYQEALALALVGDFEAADSILSGTRFGPLTLSPRGIEAHAQVLMQLDRADDAQQLLASALESRANSELSALQARISAGEVVEYDFATTAQHGAAEVYFNLAAILSGRAAPQTVLVYVRLAEHLRPDHVQAVLTSAEMLMDLDQFELAVQSYGRVPTDHPSYTLAEMGRADALFADGRVETSLEVLDALSRSHGDDPWVHSAYGEMLAREERTEEAVEAYSRSLELRDPEHFSSWPVFYRRGIAREQIEDYPGMEADFRKALELSPDQPEVLNYLGYSLVEQRIKLDEALMMIETAVAARPESGYITDSLGWIFYRLDRFEEAVAPMERAVELLPDDPIINDHLGDVYWKVGRYREAEFQWKRALSFEPVETEADRIRLKLDVGLDTVLEQEAEAGEEQTAND